MNSLYAVRPTGGMSAEDRVRLVDALDHDARQPQHSLEMGLRTLRLTTADLRARRFDESTFDSLLQRMILELTSVQAAARQVTDTLQDLFDAIRLESEKPMPYPRTIRAGDLIERVSKSNRGLAGDAEVHGISSRLTFVSDERWVERILNNLVGNAIWHSQGSRVLVGARRSGEDILFEVRDNGRGISPEKLATVFDPLQIPPRSHIGSSTRRSGLGLHNVRLFTEFLGGKVECRSIVGRGTVFRVTLPGPIGTAEKHAPPAESAASKAARNKLVAMLDADLSVLQSTERSFAPLGVEVYGDHDALRWLNVVTDLKRMPDLIIMDFNLGREQCSLNLDIVRRKWSGERLNVIILADNARDPNLVRMSWSVPVVQKPLAGQKLDLIVGVLAGQVELPQRGLLL